MAKGSPRYVYRIDKNDRIGFVNSDWLQFAQENDAAQLTSAQVLGTCVWDHVTGSVTRRLYEELFRLLRTGRVERQLPFNCDSPTIVRNMTLTIRTMGGGALELEGTLVRTQARQPASILDCRTPRTDERVAICSLCRAVLVGNDWVTVDDAIGRRRWFAGSRLPQLEESICPACEASFESRP
jgi:hypothetical protein